MSYQNKALFLDRDGIINVDSGYVHKIEDFVFVDGLHKLLKSYQEDGYKLIVVTNQSGIGRGYYTEEDYMGLTEHMVNELLKKDIKIEAVYHCPHSPQDKCSCRKPRSGMFMAAKKDHKLDMKNSIMIGDKDSDMVAAKSAKVGSRILVSKSDSCEEATKVVKDIKSIK
jgi:D-glycero-D-manno-heptose 1,7-bisphosphate phosphatase